MFIFQNGVLLRTVLDLVTGDLSDTRTRWELSLACKESNLQANFLVAIHSISFDVKSTNIIPAKVLRRGMRKNICSNTVIIPIAK